MVCQDCGRRLRSNDAAQFHATKTGHVNFAESTDVIQPLTEVEKAAKLEELKLKLAEKRAVQQEEERRQKLEQEKIRRIGGREIAAVKEKTREDLFKKELAEQKRQKQADKVARAKILAQIEADKQARSEKFAKQKQPASSAASVNTIAPSIASQ